MANSSVSGSAPPPSALSGLSVVDLSGGLAGALASMFLADNGARVTRLTRDGDDALRAPRIFAVYDRGKRVARLDDATDADALAELCAEADILLDDAPPSDPMRRRSGLDDIAARLPRLVHCSITAYGARGPIRNEPADNDLAAARIGILASQPSPPHRDGPIHVVHPVASVGAGLLAALGIVAALYRRERDGRGARVETSLMAGALLYAPKATGDGIPARAMRMSQQGGGPFYSVFECADGKWIQIGCIHSGFVDLAAAVIGVAEFIASNPEFGDGRWPRDENARQRLFDAVARAIKARPSHEWIAELQAADVPCAISQDAREAMRDPQILHNGLVHTLDDPLLGKTRMAGAPIKLSATPSRIRAPRAADVERIERAPTARQPDSGETGADAARTATLPLAGVRVMEMTNVIAGPVAGRLLADLGADSVKFESLDGDISRPGGGAGFMAFNANKRSLSANTRAEDGREIARRLAASSDVMLANMRPGATDRMGLDDATLRRLNPKLIQSHITAYGWDGPYRERPGVDPIAQAMTGLQRAQGGCGCPPVYLSALAPCDYTGGALGALGATLALLARERFGVSQTANTNLLAAGSLMCAEGFMDYEGKTARPLPGRDQLGVSPLRRLHRAADGWLCIASDAPRAADWLLDEEHAATVFASMTVAESLAMLKAEGLPCAPVVEQYGERFFADAQAIANDMATTLDHPTLGAVRYSGNLVSFDGATSLPTRPTPLLGEHTRELLAELGFGEERVDDMRRRDVVRG